jgi:hypothetical protein
LRILCCTPVKKLVLIAFCLLSNMCFGQYVAIRGRVYDKIGNEPIPFANIIVQGTTAGTQADENGNYAIADVPPGTYNLEATFVGFKKLVVYEIQVTSARTALVDFAMEEEARKLDEVVVSSGNSFIKSDESPLSLQTIGTTEIKRTPGGNRDISRTIRSLPGVASTPSFRNDIIIRGGSPSENTFYLDGIQIPVINHFQTQGSSGGPVGVINVDLLREVSFYSGAFPANKGNTMSSVFDFSLKDGRPDKWTMNGVVGASDLGITVEGPVNKKSSLIFSARRSYLQFLFELFNLPFLPVYNDVQFKYKYKLNEKNQITVLGIGAVDDFTLNLDAPEKADNAQEKEEAEYLLNALPVSEQWNYTVGLKYERFRKNVTSTFVVSRNSLNNSAVKYKGNDSSNPDNLIQDYNSRETETRFRIEDYQVKKTWKLNYGLGYEFAHFNTQDYNKIVNQQGAVVRNYSTEVSVNKWSLFTQVSNTFFNVVTISAGLRADANDYSASMNNLLDQLSPRISISYAISERVNINFNSGIYYQLPPYTVLGYRNSTTNELENKENGVTYIRSKHLVGGLEFNLKNNSRITFEGFYKGYDQYPFLIEDSISLANLGADFGVIGNAPVRSTSEGRSYGVEFLAQQKLFKGFYGILAYTLVRSEFEDKNGKLISSSWDNRHIVSLTAGKKLKRNWEIGTRWLFTGGSPYTPYNVQETVRIENWDVRPYGVPNYDQLNSKRISPYHQLDIRIDKKYFFKKWSLNIYLDVQNAYNYQTTFEDNIDVVKDVNGNPVPDSGNPGFYTPKFIQNTSGQVLPTIGVIFEL